VNAASTPASERKKSNTAGYAKISMRGIFSQPMTRTRDNGESSTELDNSPTEKELAQKLGRKKK
jgi:hypothetical protein